MAIMALSDQFGDCAEKSLMKELLEPQLKRKFEGGRQQGISAMEMAIIVREYS